MMVPVLVYLGNRAATEHVIVVLRPLVMCAVDTPKLSLRCTG